MATPLGNLEDMTFRGVRILREADLIAAEDTRRTRKLMTHYQARARLISYRDENHDRVWPGILEVLQTGGRVVLVTDAGTPGISDPGARIVREAAAEGASIVPIPGATAVAAALSVSGLGADSYYFVGFLPARQKARLDVLGRAAACRDTLVFFEAPHRLARSLADAALVLGERRATLCREMTKINEEILGGSLPSLAEAIGRRPGAIKGEITLVVEGGAPDRTAGSDCRGDRGAYPGRSQAGQGDCVRTVQKDRLQPQ